MEKNMAKVANKVKRTIIQCLIGISIVAALLYKLNAREIFDVILKIDVRYFLLAAITYLLYNVLMAFRVSYLLGKVGKVTDYHVFSAHMGAMMASEVTPARGGYFILPYLLKRLNQSDVAEGMAVIIAPAGLEFILKVAGGFLGIILLFSSVGINRGILVSLFIAGIMCLAVGIVMIGTMWTKESVSSNLLSKIPFFGKFQKDYLRIKEKSFMIKDSVHVIIGLYMVCWMLTGLQWFFVGKSLGLDLPFYVYFLLHPLITMLSFIPITPAGVGLMEMGATGVFYLLGVGTTVGLAFSLLARLNSISVDLIGLVEITKAWDILSERLRGDKSGK